MTIKNKEYEAFMLRNILPLFLDLDKVPKDYFFERFDYHCNYDTFDVLAIGDSFCGDFALVEVSNKDGNADIDYRVYAYFEGSLANYCYCHCIAAKNDYSEAFTIFENCVENYTLVKADFKTF